MMKHRCIFLIIIILELIPASILAASLEKLQAENPDIQINPLIRGTHVVCNDDYIIASIYFREPFSGSFYADRQPDPKCRSWGDGTQYNISLKLWVGDCGVITRMTDNKPEFEAAYYLQFHYKMQQAGDHTFRFYCAPHLFKISAEAGLGVRRRFSKPILMKAEKISMEEDIEMIDYQHEIEDYLNPKNKSHPNNEPNIENPNTKHNPDKKHRLNAMHKSTSQHISIAESIDNAAHKPTMERKMHKLKADRKLNLEHKLDAENKPISDIKTNLEHEPNSKNQSNSENRSIFEHKLIANHKPELNLNAEHKPNTENESVVGGKLSEEGKKAVQQKPMIEKKIKEEKPKRDIRQNTDVKAKMEDKSKAEFKSKVEFKSKIHFKPKVEFSPKVEVKSSMQFNAKRGFRISIGDQQEYIQLTEEEIEKYTRLFKPELKMIIYSGFIEPPFSTKSSAYVGENMTMVIKAKEYPGFDSQVLNCKASDDTENRHQLLINIHGCSVNEAVMPNLQMKYDLEKGHKIFYSHFRAFKFPYQDKVLLSCSLHFCNSTCPKPKCEDTEPRLDSNVTFGTYDLEPEGKQVSDFVKVSMHKSESNAQGAPFEEISNEIGDEVASDIPMKMYQVKQNGKPMKASEDDPLEEDEEEVDPLCISYTKFIVSVLFLVIVLLVSLVVTICTCVSARELKKRLMYKAFPPYGRVQEFS